ncbi:MAG: M23 family metallopeptidase [Bacteroidota bacterium]
MHRILFIIFIQLTVLLSFGQNNHDFQPPLKIPMYLSGNFGEIRADHFHSGIDIKTQGTTGLHVFAIDKGYVSRIKVQANGYGKSIYLVHPNGYTSVFGHLDRYRDDIAEYVKQIQYQRKSHQVDIYLEPGQFQVNGGDFIAYSGNTGGSFGPHLHFEMRNTGNQHPINALKFGFDIKDHIAPKFSTLFLDVSPGHGQVNGTSEKQSFELVRDQGIYTVPWGTRLEAAGDIRLGVEVFDYLDGAPNRCGVYTLEVYVNDQLTFSQVMDEFSFAESRYVNAHTDYQELITSGKKVHRLYRLPNDKLRIYGHLVNDGILKVSEGEIYVLLVVATDVAGNRSELHFTISGKAGILDGADGVMADGVVMKYNQKNTFETQDVKVEIPADALYEDIGFHFSVSEPGPGALSGQYVIHDPGTPLHKPFTLSAKAPGVNPELRDKLVFVTYNAEEDKMVSEGGEYKNGKVEASLMKFGGYQIGLDTIAPEIIPLNGSGSGNQSGKKSLRFTITDNLSGIDTYEGYIDNRWALFEYDPKNDLLSYEFDGSRVTKGQIHELELYISDSQGNLNLLHTSFTW